MWHIDERILGGKPEGKGPRVRSTLRWEDNISIFKQFERRGMD
jgi:hypothetical protein